MKVAIIGEGRSSKRVAIQSLMEACYYEQIIDEACNGDMGFNNHFRRSMTVADCLQSFDAERVWKNYAQTL